MKGPGLLEGPRVWSLRLGPGLLRGSSPRGAVAAPSLGSALGTLLQLHCSGSSRSPVG